MASSICYKCMYLPKYLRDRAEIYFYDHSSWEQSNYGELVKKLSTIFSDKSHYVLNQELYNRSKMTRRNSRRCLCIRSPLIRGPLPSACSYVVSHRPNDVEEAIQLAKLCEQIQVMETPRVAAMETSDHAKYMAQFII